MKCTLSFLSALLITTISIAQEIQTLSKDDYQLKIIPSESEERAMFGFPEKDSTHLIAAFSRKADEQGGILLLKIREDLTLEWQKNIGKPGFDFSFSGINTSDGNILLTGFSNNKAGEHLEGYLVKCSEEGDVIWTHMMSGDGDNRFIRSIETAGGRYYSIGQIQTQQRNLDGLLVSIDSEGNLKDQFRLGDELLNRTYNILEHKSQDLIISGITNANYPEDADIYIARINPSGEPVWQHQLKNPQGDIAHSMIQMDDQSYLAIGYSAEHSFPLSDPLLLHFNDEGEVLAKHSVQTGKEIKLMDGYKAPDGRVICTGFVRDGEEDDWDVIVAEFDPDSQQFALYRLDAGEGDDYAYHIVPSGEHRSLLVGYSSSTESNVANILLIGYKHYQPERN